MFFRPGLIIGGEIEHDCGGDQPGARSVGWYLEGIAPLGAFAKRPMRIAFGNCITNDDADPSVDLFKEVTLPLLRGFGVAADAETRGALDVAVKRRGAPPLGGGLVEFRCAPVRQLKPVDWCEAGLVKRVRGVAYCTKVVVPKYSERAPRSATQRPPSPPAKKVWKALRGPAAHAKE